MMDLLHVSVRVWHSCFLFCAKSWRESSFEGLGALVWNNFQKVRQPELDKYVFVDVFQRFVFIALLIKVMFLEYANGHFIRDDIFLCLGANACIGGHGVRRWRTDPSNLGRNYRRVWTSIHCGS